MRSNILLLVTALLLAAVPVTAQTSLTSTTAGAAVTSVSATIIPVASATGITAGSTGLFVPITGEYMDVTAVNGTNITVVRGTGGLGAWPIASGAAILVVPIGASIQGGRANPQGSCTGANLPRYAQIVNTFTGDVNVCLLAGTWQQRNAIPKTQPTTLVLTR